MCKENNQSTTLSQPSGTLQIAQPMEKTNPLLGTICFKKVIYRIEITEISSCVPAIYYDDFIEWLKSKAIELGLGKQCDYYSDHDETGYSPIEVCFIVNSFKT